VDRDVGARPDATNRAGLSPGQPRPCGIDRWLMGSSERPTKRSIGMTGGARPCLPTAQVAEEECERRSGPPRPNASMRPELRRGLKSRKGCHRRSRRACRARRKYRARAAARRTEVAAAHGAGYGTSGSEAANVPGGGGNQLQLNALAATWQQHGRAGPLAGGGPPAEGLVVGDNGGDELLTSRGQAATAMWRRSIWGRREWLSPAGS